MDDAFKRETRRLILVQFWFPRKTGGNTTLLGSSGARAGAMTTPRPRKRSRFAALSTHPPVASPSPSSSSSSSSEAPTLRLAPINPQPAPIRNGPPKPASLKVSETPQQSGDPSPSDEVDPLDAFMNALPDDASVPRSPTSPSSPTSPPPTSTSPPREATSPAKPNVEEVTPRAVRPPSPFRKDLYTAVPSLQAETPDVVAARRASMQIRIRGGGAPAPAPIRTWAQAGLSAAVLAVLPHSTPTPVQAQALPAVMSGRDVIAVARTGSGKTLAFALPLIRHVARRSRARPRQGPSAIVVAPTRELAAQILVEMRLVARPLGIRCVCAYGGAPLKPQIADLKRGADVIVCTPGRIIDLLAMNGGRITNMKRVTFVVLDEADRMFDLGFGPQLTRIVGAIRPDRQTVMFSATFPPQVERLARRILTRPLEILVGGNSVAAVTIRQHVEVRAEDDKFLRLLQLLGEWYDRGSTLIFVDRQDNADRIFRELSNARYKCLSLHAGLDQADRDSTILDFKNGDVKVLVATSVAARGLDVPNLTLVVNFDVPSHYEDYVHRVGRTGRAGRAGTAYTFITPEQDAFAGDLVKALRVSARSAAEATAAEQGAGPNAVKRAAQAAEDAAVPDDLRKLADEFDIKRKAGLVKYGASSGYGGRGFSFDGNDEYDAAKAALRKAQAKQYGLEEEDDEDDDDARGDDDIGSDNDRDDDVGVGYVRAGGKGDGKTRGSDGKKNANAVGARFKASQNGGIVGEGDMEVDVDNDGIVELRTAPKASVSVTEGTKSKVVSASHNKATPAAAEPLSEQAVQRMLAEAVKKAETTADAKGLSTDARRALVAQAKARVLTIAAMQNKTRGRSRASATPAEPVATAPRPDVLASDATADAPRFAGELEINDYPQHARWQVTRKGSLADVEEFTACVVTTRGNFYPAGRNPPAGQRKLHLLIEGPTRAAVRTARRDIKQKLDEAAAVSRPGDDQYAKYSVV